MEQKLVFSGGLKGIQRGKASAFYTFDTFEESRMSVLEAGGLYKIRKPLSCAADGANYRSIRDVAGLRPRGMAYVPSEPTPAIVYFYGNKCFNVKPLESMTDRIKFEYTSDTSVWTGKGSDNGYKYKWELFIDASDNDYLFCVGGDTCESIKLSDFSVATVANLPTTGCNAICLNNRRLWVFSGDKAFYSAVDDGTSFNAANFLRLFENDNVCEAKVYDNIIFVFTDKAIYYITGNDTSDFKVKILENTQCILDSTFDSDSQGIYFMDKYSNIRVIGSNPYYNSGARSQIISNNLNLYDKFISNDLQYPSFINVARNQEKVHVNLGVSKTFALTNYTIDCTKSTTTDFTTGTWTTSGGTWTETATTIKRPIDAGSLTEQGHSTGNLTKANFDLQFKITLDGSNTLQQVGLNDSASAIVNAKNISIITDGSNKIAWQATGTSGYMDGVGNAYAAGTYYFRILGENYNSTANSIDISFWIKSSDPAGSWGTATKTETGVVVNYNWYLSIINTGSATLASPTVSNLIYVEGGTIGATSLNDIYNFIYDLRTKEWTEYANFSGTTRQYPIEYMSPSKDKVLNTAQYLGCQYTTTVGGYTDTNNFIGVFNQKGTTKDSSEFYVQSNAFNLETPNKKILREFYADFIPTDATVTLYLQNEGNFGSDLTSIMSVRSGWNTVPRIYRGRQFKYGLKTTEADEFQLKQMGFRFEDLGQKAF